jgi:chromosome segregation ATPase
MPHSDATRKPLNGNRLARITSRPAPDELEKALEEGLAATSLPLKANRDRLACEDPESAASGNQPPSKAVHAPDKEALEQLRLENTELRRTLAEYERALQESRQMEEAWTERQREYDSLLDEKSDVIRELHRKLQETQATPERPSGVAPREEELLALHDELERERRQLKDDEESLMGQMRDMELQMSRERAELARQRNELQRLHTEIRHELELAARDATLRDRLAPLQRRAQEAINRRGGAPTNNQTQQMSNPGGTPAEEPRKTKESGVFRRLFGK